MWFFPSTIQLHQDGPEQASKFALVSLFCDWKVERIWYPNDCNDLDFKTNIDLSLWRISTSWCSKLQRKALESLSLGSTVLKHVECITSQHASYSKLHPTTRFLRAHDYPFLSQFLSWHLFHQNFLSWHLFHQNFLSCAPPTCVNTHDPHKGGQHTDLREGSKSRGNNIVQKFESAHSTSILPCKLPIEPAQCIWPTPERSSLHRFRPQDYILIINIFLCNNLRTSTCSKTRVSV